MGVASLVLAVVAILLVFWIEWLRRPRLHISPSTFVPSFPVLWTFAAVRVHNRPMRRPLRRFLSRSIAQGCAVQVRFEQWSADVGVLPSIPGRWSGNPQPLRPIVIQPPDSIAAALAPAGSLVQRGWEFDRTLDPPRRDIPVSPDGEEVAVAILLAPLPDDEGGAYAWGTESYAFTQTRWQKPDWKLARGTYRVRISVTGSDVSARRSFKLEYLDEDFAKFVLHPA